MGISYYYQFQDEKPQLISGEVIFKHYIKQNTTISGVDADANRMTIYLGSQIHQCLVIEPGPTPKVTFRHIQGRRR